jgi:hypothetical protein
MTPTIGLEFAVEAVAKQSVVVGIRFKVNASAVAAISPGGTAARHKFFAAKRDAAVPSVTSLYVNFGFINKHVDSISASQDEGSTRRRHSAGFLLAALLWRASGASATWSLPK